MPYYNCIDFQKACNNPNDVILINPVPRDAGIDFNLNSKASLLTFINNDGLEDLKFVNTKEWENNPNKSHPILVDAYEFRSMGKLGYIAFMYNDLTNKWIIKSFHLSKNRNLTMLLALEKAGLLKENNNE